MTRTDERASLTCGPAYGSACGRVTQRAGSLRDAALGNWSLTCPACQTERISYRGMLTGAGLNAKPSVLAATSGRRHSGQPSAVKLPPCTEGLPSIHSSSA